MADVDIYADVVATTAAGLAAWSLGWQIKSNWWDRPNIVFENDRVAIERRYDRTLGDTIDLGWTAQVTVSNTGNADTTLLAVDGNSTPRQTISPVSSSREPLWIKRF